MKLHKLFKFRMIHDYDIKIHACVLILIFIGSLMVISCSVGDSITNSSVVFKTILKQSVFVMAAYLAMTNVSNYFSLNRINKIIKPLGIVLCILLGVCLFFDGAGGAKSWIYFRFAGVEISIQPSEFFKVYMILIMACLIEKTKRLKQATWLDITLIPLSFFVIGCGLIYVQNDLGSIVVITLICAISLLIPSHPSLKTFQKISFYGLMGLVVLMGILMSDFGLQLVEHIPFFGSHVAARFETSANPWVDEYNTGLQLINSLYAFASGGFFGLGPGQSIQKLKYLPAASTDYILAITVEELGVLGFLIILICYSMIILQLFKYAFKSKMQGYKMIYIGTSLYIFLHFVFNVGGVTGLIPLTGIPLLFISAGASSLVSVCMAIGICQACISLEKNMK